MKLDELRGIVFNELKPHSPNLLERMVLAFKPTYMMVDPCATPEAVDVAYKKWRGGIYITKIYRRDWVEQK